MGVCAFREKNAYFEGTSEKEAKVEMMRKYLDRQKVPHTIRPQDPITAESEVSSASEDIVVEETLEATKPQLEEFEETPEMFDAAVQGDAVEEDSRSLLEVMTLQMQTIEATPKPPVLKVEQVTQETQVEFEEKPVQMPDIIIPETDKSEEQQLAPEEDILDPFPQEAVVAFDESESFEDGEENLSSSMASNPGERLTRDFLVRPQPLALESPRPRFLATPQSPDEAAYVFLRSKSHYLRNPAPLLPPQYLDMNFQGRLTIEKETELRTSIRGSQE